MPLTFLFIPKADGSRKKRYIQETALRKSVGDCCVCFKSLWQDL